MFNHQHLSKMKQKYIQVVGDEIIPNGRIEELDKNYKIIGAVNNNGKTILMLKRRNIFARIINHIF